MKSDHLLRHVITKNGEKIMISRRKKEGFLQFINQYTYKNTYYEQI